MNTNFENIRYMSVFALMNTNFESIRYMSVFCRLGARSRARFEEVSISGTTRGSSAHKFGVHQLLACFPRRPGLEAFCVRLAVQEFKHQLFV